MIIHFQSRFAHRENDGNALLKKKNSWNDIDSIRPYMYGNDAKNIFWKKSTLQIVEKTFENSGKISIITGIIRDFGDDFETENAISKKEWKSSSEKNIFQNAKYQWLIYHTFSEDTLKDFCKKILQFRIQKRLIIIFCNDWNQKNIWYLKKIATLNEIIWISSYHIFEKNPHENILLEWTIFSPKNLKAYKNSLEMQEKNFKKQLQAIWIFYLNGFTHEKIENILNQFFKYQYAKK